MSNNKNGLYEFVRIAYKKLKASVYYDKMLLPLRDKIVDFEDDQIDKKLLSLVDLLLAENDKLWGDFTLKILNDIEVLAFPKELEPISDDSVIYNEESGNIKLKKPQYFIEMPVSGQIIGVLWVLSFGLALDNRNDDDGMYEHSYGNRLRSRLTDENSLDFTYSTGLFEPYFGQYSTWRDKGLKLAKSCLENKQDAMILTLDFKSFFYSVDLSENNFESFISKFEEYRNGEPCEIWHRRINEFVFKVLGTYSDKLKSVNNNQGNDDDLKIESLRLLPIGFLPSPILANWVLNSFDKAIIERWNPIYYGRYVDDILIVDKVEKNSPIYKTARKAKESGAQTFTADFVIRYFTQKCQSSREKECENIDEAALLKPDDNTGRYFVNNCVLDNNSSKIGVQKKKVKIFYFKNDATSALLDCFQKHISINASEFNFLADLNDVFEHNDYSEIFDLKNSETPNKFRGVTSVSINKYELSKFLGKYGVVGRLVNDHEETALEKDILQIMDKRILIDNYGCWERLLEILIVNDRLVQYEKLTCKIIDAIYEINPNGKVNVQNLCDALLKYLYSAFCRTAALVLGKPINKRIENICKHIEKRTQEPVLNAAAMFDSAIILKRCNLYRKTRMINKYVMPLLIDCILEKCDKSYDCLRLFNLNEVLPLMSAQWANIDVGNYNYYPYINTPQELSYALICLNISCLEVWKNPVELFNIMKKLYRKWNYLLESNNYSEDDKKYAIDRLRVDTCNFNSHALPENYAIFIETPKKDRLTIAVGNAKVYSENFTKALQGKPYRKYKRYREVMTIINDAARAKADLLVLPECYMPFDWIPAISQNCAKQDMAIITGVEHIIQPDLRAKHCKPKVFNLTAVILPYKHEGHPYAYVSYHSKVHFAPDEKRLIDSYSFEAAEGNFYQVFCWHDIWFPVYCCFELASITDRALFRSLADLFIAVEYNKDVNYYSSIVESLSRDLHCYCVQANSSHYGDSRVIQPTNTETKDLIKTKGGKNCTILTTDVDIKSLREFQLPEYHFSRDGNIFKPTPPTFDRRMVKDKINGMAWSKIINKGTEPD